MVRNLEGHLGDSGGREKKKTVFYLHSIQFCPFNLSVII